MYSFLIYTCIHFSPVFTSHLYLLLLPQGILGSVQSGKSALVHRYLTGSYMQEESPEGGRFKKEVIIDGQSYLLLIRDEGGAPEMQVGRIVTLKFNV